MPEPLEIIVDKATATVEYPLGEGDYLISFMQGEEDMIVTATEDELKNAGIIPDNQEVCYITVRRGPDGKEICEYAPMPMDEQDAFRASLRAQDSSGLPPIGTLLPPIPENLHIPKVHEAHREALRKYFGEK